MLPRNCEIPKNGFDRKSQKCTTVLSLRLTSNLDHLTTHAMKSAKKKGNKHTAGIVSDPMRCSTKIRKKLLQKVL